MDRRVIKTKKAIRIALTKLLAEKDLENITVKELAERADINRKTFYNYYSGVHQVLAEIENELAQTIEIELKKLDLRHGQKDPASLYRFLTDVLGRDREFYAALLNMGGNVSLLGKVGERLHQSVADMIRNQYQGPAWQIDVMVDYVIFGLLRVFQQNFAKGEPAAVEEIASFMGLLGMEGFQGWVKSLENPGVNRA